MKKIKMILTALIGALFLGTAAAAAATTGFAAWTFSSNSYNAQSIKGAVNEWEFVSYDNIFEFNEETGTILYIKQIMDENGTVTVPKEINGVPVTHIDKYAFSNQPDLTSIVIEAENLTIESYAFYGDYNLKEITLPSSTKLLKYSFAYSGSYNSSTKTYSIDSVTFTGSATELTGNQVFKGLEINTITIPAIVTNVEKSFFDGVEDYEMINYGGSVEDFVGTDHNNDTYSIFEGLVYNLRNSNAGTYAYQAPTALTISGRVFYLNQSNFTQNLLHYYAEDGSYIVYNFNNRVKVSGSTYDNSNCYYYYIAE
jgi:hypothetical protein